MKKILIFALFALLLFSQNVIAQTSQCNSDNNSLEVYFFYREGCQHCHEETEFLQKLEEKFEGKVTVQYLSASENLELFYSMAESFGAPTQWLPATFIPCCDWYVVGFDEDVGKEIESRIETRLDLECEKDNYVLVPILGRIKTEDISLPAFTITLGLLDGFNPCAMFILMILLSLLIHTKSRKRVAFIAGTFVFASGLVYFMFMAVWLNVFLFLGVSNLVRTALALLALAVGLMNVKDFFFFGKGPSLSISDGVKPGIFDQMRKIIQSNSLPIILFGTIFLAFSVNLFEFLCTAGFPAVFTKVLSEQNLSPAMHYAYLLLYTIFYMIDDAIMVGIAVVTLRSKKVTETVGKWLKLVSGIVMLVLALAMLFAPELLVFI